MAKAISIPVYSVSGKPAEAWQYPAEVLGHANPALLAQAIRVYQSNLHQKTSKVKTRGEVDGSTKKIYRQKGTGNARHGAKYAPIFVGGGIAHGPTGIRANLLVLPKAMRRRALGAAIQAKLTDQKFSGVAALKTFSGKTSAILDLLKTTANHPEASVLVITFARAEKLYRSLANLQQVTLKRASLVNAYDLVAADYILITKKALDSLITRISL